MTEQQTLVEFLTARIEEDRKMAQDAIDDRHGIGDFIFFDTGNTDLAEHYERYDPARVLREVAAKRALLSIHHARDSWGHCMGCGTDNDGSLYMAIDDCPVLRLVAAVYSDHPDYQEEWRP